jgi:hypothetical protein
MAYPVSQTDILNTIYQEATQSRTVIIAPDILIKLEYVCRNQQNRAGVRLLLACLLAKLHRPDVDIRKPYTEIGGSDTFSGRTYDEQYIAPFVLEHDLPCNATTAFLTPALRNRNITLTPDVNLVGRPPELYQSVLELLATIHNGTIAPDILLIETVRLLLTLRDERRQRLRALLAQLQSADENIPLAAESIVSLVESHMRLPKSSRLPVLLVAAAYEVAAVGLGEHALPLQAHHAADKQTGALGDIEVVLLSDERVYTVYEMKDKRMAKADIELALAKISTFAQRTGYRIGQYIFITTEPIDRDVAEYAANLYTETHGIEIGILDCISFLRHFLHLFHRLRMQVVDAYQELVLAEPASAVSDALKEAFLALRRAAESGVAE